MAGGQGRETWRGQCRAGEEEEGAVRWSSLSRSLTWLPLHQTEAPVVVGGGEPREDSLNGGHPPWSACPSPSESSLEAEGRPWTLQRRNSEYTRGQGPLPVVREAPPTATSTTCPTSCPGPSPATSVSSPWGASLLQSTPLGQSLRCSLGVSIGSRAPWSPPNP